MDATTAGGMSAEFVSRHVTAMLESGQEDSLLCPWHNRVAVGMRYWAPDLLSYIMKIRANKKGTSSTAAKGDTPRGDGALKGTGYESGRASGTAADLKESSDGIRRRVT